MITSHKNDLLLKFGYFMKCACQVKLCGIFFPVFGAVLVRAGFERVINTNNELNCSAIYRK